MKKISLLKRSDTPTMPFQAIIKRLLQALNSSESMSKLELQIDTFIDIDRGYSPHNGLVDRYLNYREAAFALLNTKQPPQTARPFTTDKSGQALLKKKCELVLVVTIHLSHHMNALHPHPNLSLSVASTLRCYLFRCHVNSLW